MKLSTVFIALLVMTMICSCMSSPEMPSKVEITEIIVETIRQNSLDTNVPICLNLVNRYNCQLQYNKEFGYVPPPPRNKQGEPFVFALYKSMNRIPLGFDNKDSTFVARQINSNKDVTLELKILPKNIKFKDVSALKNNESRLYTFLVPVFNKNKDFAIVEYDSKRVGYGHGTIVIFRKINGKWIKIKSFRSWQS